MTASSPHGYRVSMKKLALLCLFLTGCAASLVPGYEKPTSYYRGPSRLPWKIHVVSQWRVWWECGFPWSVVAMSLGCTNPDDRQVWMINSLALEYHECSHVNALEEGGTERKEWIKDATYGWVLLNVGLAATLPVPAREKPCGPDFDGSTSSKWTILPSALPAIPPSP